MPWFDSLITIIIIWIWYMKQAIAGRNSNYKRRRNAKLSAQNSQAVSQAVAGEGRQAAGLLAQPYIIIFSISKAFVPSWTTQWDPIYTVNTLTVKNSGVIQAHFPCFLAAKTSELSSCVSTHFGRRAPSHWLASPALHHHFSIKKACVP